MATSRRSPPTLGLFLEQEPQDGAASLRRTKSAESSLLFAEDVAALVGMTRYWVYAETRAGRIPHLTLGRYYRYRPESIDAWLRQIERGSVMVPRADGS
jgi:excisionase family DNA binding protein